MVGDPKAVDESNQSHTGKTVPNGNKINQAVKHTATTIAEYLLMLSNRYAAKPVSTHTRTHTHTHAHTHTRTHTHTHAHTHTLTAALVPPVLVDSTGQLNPIFDP